MPKYSFSINTQLSGFLGEAYRFQGRTFSVEDCDSPEEAESLAQEWLAKYVTDLVKRRKETEEKTLTDEMMLEFGNAIRKASEARKQQKDLTIKKAQKA